MILYKYSKEKFCLGRSWELKDKTHFKTEMYWEQYGEYAYWC